MLNAVFLAQHRKPPARIGAPEHATRKHVRRLYDDKMFNSLRRDRDFINNGQQSRPLE